MKNLKKLSVVLFATLLSFNFTSCIEDGVSDAVDQVYLAQATFLRAQAALQEAKAQHELAEAVKTEAEAQYQLALAEVQLAMARQTDANVANIIAGAAHTAALNAMTLQEKQADLEVYLVEAQEELAEAQSDLAVTMLELSEAIADAKNDMIRDLFGTYSQKMYYANQYHNEKLLKLTAIAKQNLFLIASDDVTMAFAMAELVGALADLEAGMAAAQAEIVRLEGLDPSTAQEDVSALRADSLALVAASNDLGVDLAALENEKAIAKAAWEGAATDLGELATIQGMVDEVQGAIDDHESDIEAAEAAIAAAEANIAGLPAKMEAVVTAEADTVAAVAAIAAAQLVVDAKIALVGSSYSGASSPKVTSSPKAETTAWNKVWNAELAALQATAAYDSINKYMQPATGGYPLTVVNDLETALVYAINSTSGTLPTDVQAAQDDYDAALLIETAAQDTFNTDPAGSTWVDGDDIADGNGVWETSFVGDHSDTPTTSFLEVLTWVQIPATVGNYFPATYVTTSIPAIPGDAGGVTYDEFTVAIGLGAEPTATEVYYIEIEEDDNSTDNIDALWQARYDAGYALWVLRDLQGDIDFDATDVALAQSNLDLAYTALGYTPPSTGNPLSSNWYQSEVKLVELYKAKNAAIKAIGYEHGVTFGAATPGPHTLLWWHSNDASMSIYLDAATVGGTNVTAATNGGGAYANVVSAEAAVTTAENARGTEFRPLDTDGKDWTTQFTLWYDLAHGALVDDTYTEFTAYQPLQTTVNADGDYERLYLAPHVAVGTGTISAFENLRNVYFSIVWAMEAVEACETVDYTSSMGNEEGDSNADTIEEATADIAEIMLLLPSHELALAELEAQLMAAVIEFDLDLLLFDPADHSFSIDIDGSTVTNLGYLPYLVDYLNAIVAEDAVEAEMMAITTQLGYIGNMIDHIQLYLLGSATDFPTGDDIASFNTWRNGEVTAQMNLIYGTTSTDGFIKDIEQAEVDIELGKLDKATAERAIEELERELEVIVTKLGILEGTAADILSRIEALMN